MPRAPLARFVLAASLALTARGDARAQTIVELQQFRQPDSVATEGTPERPGTISLVDLNPGINAWFVLTLERGAAGRASYHLENPRPTEQRLSLTGTEPGGIRISAATGDVTCELWSDGSGALDEARRSSLPYAPLCGGRLYLRNRVGANPTDLETVTDFLRDHVWGGERIIGFVRKSFFRDAFLEEGKAGTNAVRTSDRAEHAPPPASVSGGYADRTVVPAHLGIELAGAPAELAFGRWYPVSGIPGVHVSAIEPQAIAGEILDDHSRLVNRLDPVESRALAYLVAFDLGQHELGFALGTEHPRVGWSARVQREVHDPDRRGPDGIDGVAPLARNGTVSPAVAPRVIASFTGGFKREHGAFRHGALARQNDGSHYGFIEQGTVFSRLVPGLATLYVLNDGSVAMKTWTKDDDVLLPRIKHARQNGVALVERDPATGASAPGPLVTQWGAGNWSGSADEKLRTLRAGACVQESGTRRFLVYGYFSSATPSAMARVFQAYGCSYAMHLDMNALEHTYLALYTRNDSQMTVQHLIEGMAVVDRKSRGRLVPRFLGAPDDRDFFYVVRRERTP